MGVSRQPQLIWLYMGKSRLTVFCVDLVKYSIDFFLDLRSLFFELDLVVE